MRMSDNISDLAKALAAAQGEMEGASKNAQNPHLKNRYADIAAVWEAMRGVLPKHGLAVSQVMCDDTAEGTVCVESILMHASGQWIASRCSLPAPKRDPQGYGSAITYARRYSLSALVGVVSEEDDDGEGAKAPPSNGNGTSPQQRGTQRPPQPPRQGAEQQPQGQAPQRQRRQPQDDHQPAPQIQHISLEDACWEFMQCNSERELYERAQALQVKKSNPNYAAIFAAYNSRLQDVKGEAPQAPGNDRGSQPSQGGKLTTGQRTAIMAHYGKRGMATNEQRDARLADLSSFIGRPIASVNDITFDEASSFLEAINENREAA